MAQRKVQSTQLSDTGVVPGPYTLANITIDSSGRITTAANGSSGGGSAPLNEVVLGTGPGISSSVDFTFDPTTGELNVNQNLGYSLTPGDVTIGASSSDGTGNIAGGDVSVYSGSASGFQTPGKILLETGTSADNASRAKILLTRPISSVHASSVEMYAAAGNTSADGGYVSIRGGRAGGDVGTLGGVVEILAGNGYLSGAGGSIRFSTQAGLALEILNTGDFQFGGSSGTAGQVITSAGPGLPPTWQTASGSVSAPLNQIVYGTGPGVTSDPDLTFDSTTNILTVGAAANGAITAATGFSISLESDGGTYEITLKSTGDVRLNGSTGTSGQVLTSAGSGTPAYWSTPTGGAQSLLTTTVTFN